jgi:serine protease Do
MSTTIADVQDSIRSVAAGVGPATVGLGRGWGVGTGVVTGPGRVLTNAHNLRGDEVAVTFADGRVAEGEVAGVDPDLDLAAIAVDTADVEPVAWPQDVTPAEIGTAVIALGNPGGRGLRATLGFVSATERRFRGPRGRRISGAIEHTAPLPRGSSGGPLVDLEGRLVGLNTVRREGGLILAVPADAVLRDHADALWSGTPAARPRLGVAIAPPRVARRLRRSVGLPEREGLLVRAVEEASAAESAGIEAGDLIVAAAQRPLDSVDAFYAALDERPAEEPLALTIVRGNDEREVDVAFAKARA